MTAKHAWLMSACLLAGCRPQPPAPAFPSLAAALASLTEPGWHRGTLADCTDPFLEQMLTEDSSYQPYEVLADLNHDGLRDAAVALVKADSGKIYWIPARNGGFDQPQLLGTLDWIKEGGLVARDSTVIFGRFYSDVSVTWQWHSAAGKLEVLPARTDLEE